MKREYSVAVSWSVNLTILAITLYFLEFFNLNGFLNMLNHISDLVFEISIGGKEEEEERVFQKLKNS